jgi:DNA-binding transcriptional LysR family regulator
MESQLTTITLRQLEYFLAVSNSKSMRAAAADLRLSESALGSAIDQLQASLGQQLCVRRRSIGVTLTSTGSLVAEGAARILAEVDALETAVRGSSTRLAGSLRIGVPASVAGRLVPRLIERIAAQHPDIDLGFEFGNREEMLRRLDSGDIDMALVVEFGHPLGHNFDELYRVPVRVGVGPNGPHGDRPIRIADLLDGPLILLDTPFGRECVRLLYDSAGSAPVPMHRVPTLDVALGLVAGGLGYCFVLHDPWVALPVGVTLRETEPAIEAARMALVWPQGVAINPRAAAARAILHEVVLEPSVR